MQYIVLFILLTRNIYWRYAFSQKVDNSGQKLNDLLICLTNQTYCEIDYLLSQVIRFELGVLSTANILALRGVGSTLRPVGPTGWKRSRRPRGPGFDFTP